MMMLLSRIKFQIAPLVNEILDQLPDHVWTSNTTTFLDPAMGGGQFLVEIERRLAEAGHSDDNISSRVFGCERNQLRLNYSKMFTKLRTNNLFVSDGLSHDWGDMKFDIVIGNPPFSKAGEGKIAGKRSQELYIQFYKWAVSNAQIVAMVMPTTDKKVQKTHNDLLRSTANIVGYIDPGMFGGIAMPMWYVIANKNDNTRANIEWSIDGTQGNNIPWVKGAVNMTTHKNLVGEQLGYPKPKKKTDVLIYHKVNITNGLVTLYCDQKFISPRALFPQHGWAVLMPQTFNDDGWTQTEIVKCNGAQAAFNGMNIVFVRTKSQGEKLVKFMKTSEFVDEGNRVKQGFNNMNLSCLSSIKLTKSFEEIINAQV